MTEYMPRLVDKEIQRRLEYVGAVLIEGPKWCGKSTTAKVHAKSIVEFQDPDKKNEYDMIESTKPSLFLNGEKPRLFDEWQMYPVVWDSIRIDVDRTGLKGQYILTGSAKPAEGSTMHTGTGRFTRILMRPMSMYESKESNGRVSLKSLFTNENIEDVNEMTLENLAGIIVRGGWPASLSIISDNKYRVAKDYVESLIKEEVKAVDKVERNSAKMKAVLKSLARNVSTSVSNVTLIEDVQNEFNENISRPTLDDYLTALEKLFVVESIPATKLSIRSKTELRTKPKLEFVDPSIATAVLGLSPADLLQDLNYFGFVFENLCIRDLQIYASMIGGEISYYRDKNNLEVDVIVKLENGKWGAVEIKLGAGFIESAIQNLLKFKDNVDFKKSGEPSFLMVLTGSNYSYKTKEGVYVVSIASLRD